MGEGIDKWAHLASELQSQIEYGDPMKASKTIAKVDLNRAIDDRIGEVRTDSVDLSFGEIINLHSNRELIIRPEYQRLFRWSNEQRSRLIESILLELPIPQIFVIENSDGVLELIDGLQRLSSVIQFINPIALSLEALRLEGCDLIPELNGKSFEDLPLGLRLGLKRSAVRTVLIKKQSKSFIRYEMFKRLNTGGSLLSNQEIRNCSARMVGKDGTAFYEFIQRLSEWAAFVESTESISATDLEQRGLEELVLRFFALKNARGNFRGSVRDWLDSYMEDVIFKRVAFDYDKEEAEFRKVFAFVAKTLGSDAFVKYRNGKPIGSLAPAYYEAVTMGILSRMHRLQKVAPEKISRAVAKVLESKKFRSFTGPGANTKPKMESRIECVEEALTALQ
jgi:hypothetical protein